MAGFGMAPRRAAGCCFSTSPMAAACATAQRYRAFVFTFVAIIALTDLPAHAVEANEASREDVATRPSAILSAAPIHQGRGHTGAAYKAPRTAQLEPDLAPEPARVFWIAPGGDDGNDCSEAAPCATPQHAAAKAMPGDTWYFSAGTYAGSMNIKNSGEPGAPITFSAAPGDEREVVFDGGRIRIGAWGSPNSAETGVSHFRLVGFKVQNTGTAIKVRGHGTDIRIENNWTLDTRHAGIRVFACNWNAGEFCDDVLTDVVIAGNRVDRPNQAGGPIEGLTVGNGVSGFVIRDNELIDTGHIAIDLVGGVRNGKVHHNHITGGFGRLYLDTAHRYVTDVEIFGNVVENSRSAGIHLTREVWQKGHEPELARIKIYNNIVNNVGRDGILLGVHPQDSEDGLRGTIEDIEIMNNTVYRAGTRSGSWRGIVISHPLAKSVVVRNNIVQETNGQDYRFKSWRGEPVLVDVSHNISSDGSEGVTRADPLFVDAISGDFRLTSGSPAIGMGTLGPAPAEDIDGNPRPPDAGVDIGAFQAR